MGLRINTNVSSIGVQNRFVNSTNALGGVMRRLASGQRIATAADDAAGLGISERMRAQLRSHRVAKRNVQDGISMLQSADGMLSEITDRIHRVRELAVQAASGTMSASDRATLDAERAEIAQQTIQDLENFDFNGNALFSGPDTIAIQVGLDESAESVIEIDLLGVSAVGVAMNASRLTNDATAQFAMFIMDTALDFVNQERSRFGAMTNRLESAQRSLGDTELNLAASESRIRDVDVASETASLARHSILQQGGAAVLAQANVQPQLALQLLG